MTKTRLTRLVELTVAALALAAVAVAVLAGNRSSAATGGPVPSSEPDAARFAHAFLGYLDGQLPASRLPDATAAARGQVGEIIPAAQRAGTLRLTRLTDDGVSGARTARVVLIAKDRRHSLSARFALAYGRGGWRVVSVVGPDLATVLRPRTSPALAGAGAARRVAAGFAQQYIDHAEGLRKRLPDAPAAVLAQIRSGQDPLSRLTPARRRARVTRVSLGPLSGQVVDAIVRFRAAGQTQTFALELTRAGGGWEIWRLIDASLGVRP